MADVFISYAREDKDKARMLANALEDQGWSVWWDPQIPAGREFDDVIEEALDAAKCVVVLWSNRSIVSRWVKTEAGEGLDRDILVPVLIEDIKPPLAFRRVHAADLTVWSGDSSYIAFLRLVDSIKRVASPSESKTRIRKRSSRPAKIPENLPQSFTNSLGMKFVLVPAGTFQMGSDEHGIVQPIHQVAMRKSFYMQNTQVTQGQWKRVKGENPSSFEDYGEDCPVENVTWDDVKQFLGKLNALGDGEYRLPTEAEWEYAARSGGKDQAYAGGDNINELGWYTENSDGRTHPVGQKKPNGLGIYDMSGNVFEWVEDDWHDVFKNAPHDGSAWVDVPRGPHRVVRGGSWRNSAWYCLSGTRLKAASDLRNFGLGFRLAKSITLDS